MILIGIDKVGSAIEFIDPSLQHSVASLVTTVAPHDVVLGAEGRFAYVTLYGDGVYRANQNPGKKVLVLDLVSRTIVDTIPLDPYDSPHGITLDRRGLIWVTCDPHARIVALSVESKSLVGEVGTENTGTHWVLASPTRDLLFCSSKNERMISVIDPASMRLERQIMVPHGTEGIAFGPDGTLYAADHKEFCVLVIDGNRMEIVSKIMLEGADLSDPMESHHMRLLVSPDGGMLAVAAYHRDLLILVDLEYGSRQKVLRTGKGPMALAFSPLSGNQLFLSNHDEGTVSVVDFKAGRIESTFPCGQGIEALIFAGH